MIKKPDQKINCLHPAEIDNGQIADIAGAKYMFFGNVEIDRLNVQAVQAILVITLIIGIFILLTDENRPTVPLDIYTENSGLFRVDSGEEMIDLLKENDLWEVDIKGSVAPLLFASYPDNIDDFDISIKKRVFFHSLLPVALTALEEIRKEKMVLHNILAKFPGGYRQLIFSDDDYEVWGRFLTADEIEFIMMLAQKYRTNVATIMVKRVDLVPLSMIMAQGALESSWATSRFAKEGNNLFGIWTWGETGMAPANRDEGMDHKVAKYESILDSVRAYVLTLNRLPAYSRFREIRKQTMNSLKLADGLLEYSERGDVYVWEVKNIIQYNNLRQYDKCFLVDRPIQYRVLKSVDFTMLEEPDYG
jgi:Bax protein